MSVLDLVNIFKAVSFASIASAALVLFIWRFQGFSRTVFIIDWLMLFIFVSGSRVLERVYKEIFDQASLAGKKVLIYGAGDAGEFVLREIRNNTELHSEPVGFLDDDREKIGHRIHGVAILGTRNDLERFLKSKEADELIIAIPGIDKYILEEVITICNSLEIKYRKMSDILPK